MGEITISASNRDLPKKRHAIINSGFLLRQIPINDVSDRDQKKISRRDFVVPDLALISLIVVLIIINNISSKYSFSSCSTQATNQQSVSQPASRSTHPSIHPFIHHHEAFVLSPPLFYHCFARLVLPARSHSHYVEYSSPNAQS